MSATYCINPNYDSINIFFDSIPDKSLREKMKDKGFRWHKKDRYWFARKNPARLNLAKKICGESAEKTQKPEQKTEEPKPEKAKANKFGVQVGDIFHSSWGYDETHNTFLQVIKLCGDRSVRVREVIPTVIENTPESSMSETTTYEINREMLPAKEFSVFIKDQEKGDLKRIKSYASDGISNPLFSLTDYANAYLCKPGELQAFESWWR